MSKRATFLNHGMEIAVATGWFCVGLALLMDPSVAILSPVGRYVGDWQYVWSLLYVFAAPAVWFGIADQQTRYRVAGLSLLSGGLLMQGTAAVTYAIEPRAFFYFVHAAACVVRAFHLVITCRERRS